MAGQTLTVGSLFAGFAGIGGAMTHTRQIDDSEGVFSPWRPHDRSCPRGVADGQRCGATVRVRTWESQDGAYADEQYQCAHGHHWWIEGPDA
jgi:hypothetical protein